MVVIHFYYTLLMLVLWLGQNAADVESVCIGGSQKGP